ncbi:MAG: PD-(D/E)XK nuclease family protein, partial [Candidatus Omnitrophica bacterium]|nr:PD-(D/E)XK nuclease family protein [Candidatus Omnitrophota bacterium]
FTNAFNSLLRTEGAILLMPGRSAEMENLRFLLHRALEQLNPVLQAVGSNGIRAEYALDGSLSGNRLRGRADLLLYDRNNQPSVVDMKWGRAEERRKNLQQGLHIQLLAYASMVHEKTGQWPSLAYFIVKNARLLVAPSAATLPGEVVRHEDDESPGSLWQRVINSFDWRMAQLQAGFFSVADTGDTGNPMLIPPVEGLPLAPGDNPYNPYRFLEGWEGNE